MPIQIVHTPTLAKKMREVADEDAQQWSGVPTEAIATPPRHDYDSTITTWHRTERMRTGKVKTMEGPQDEDQDIQGGT